MVGGGHSPSKSPQNEIIQWFYRRFFKNWPNQNSKCTYTYPKEHSSNVSELSNG